MVWKPRVCDKLADDGREIKETVLKKYSYLGDNPEFVVKNQKCYFKPGITWSALSSSLPSMRMFESGFIFDAKGQAIFPKRESDRLFLLGYLNSRVCASLLSVLTPTLDFNSGYIARLPLPRRSIPHDHVKSLIELSREEWDESELSWNYSSHVLTRLRSSASDTIKATVESFKSKQNNRTARFERLEQLNDETFMNAFGLSKDDVAEHQYDAKTLRELDPKDVILNLLSYVIGCMMGRYSLDKPGLICAHSGNQDFDSNQYATFPADQDGIIPITDTDWFPDDAANRVIEFIAVAWPDEHLEENLNFVAESLGPKRGESPRETIRRYLFTHFYKHHLSMYKKRPIYWLFSSGKQRAFQCLVYLHRYNEGTLSRMRTEYVIPLQGKINARINQLKDDITAVTSTSHRKKLEKERGKLVKQQAELLGFDEKLRHYADQRITLDLDDGVKVSYAKFGDLLSEVKAVTGRQAD